MNGFVFVVRIAWREAHAARSRLALLTASVMVGVGALVAVNSFTDNVTVSVAEQAQALLGADLALNTRQPLKDLKLEQRLVDSLRQVGGAAVRVANSANFVAMAYRPNTGAARLVQVRSVDPGWPYYGAISTAPVGIWARLQDDGAIVDPSLLTALGVKVGDTLAIGEARFPILGTVLNVPGDIGLQMAFGARVFVATHALPATKLLGFGSRVQYETFIQMPGTINPQAVERRYAAVFRSEGTSIQTVADDRDALTHRLTDLGNYLGLIALAALLLGGLGVASAVHVFIRQRLDTIAVLRTLGATSWQVFAIHLLQAVVMGLLGSIVGALIGIGLQQVLPLVVKDLIPVGVRVVPSPRAILLGVALGVWVAGVFALLPLLGIRSISPLATLRRAVDPPRVRWDHFRAAAALALGGSVVGLASVQAGSILRSAWFAAGCSAALGLLWLVSVTLIRTARHWTPAWLPYLGRQGLANLHRPANQTVAVVLALGFGGFLLSTIFTVERNLLRDIRVEDPTGSRPNLVLFDIQGSQRLRVDSILRAEGVTPEAFTAMVPMRIRELKGQLVTALQAAADSATPESEPMDRGRRSPAGGPSLWALRREYRSTYRSELGPAERVIAGHWFGAVPLASGRSAADPVAVSMEAGLAEQLGVGLGDAITWDVQGVPVYSRITSLRDVNWARFDLNFFVVFAPGALETAPQSWATMVRVPDDAMRGRIQRQMAERAANVTSIDLGEVQHAIELVISRITLAVRFMALFSFVTGTVVLIGAIATSRWQRIREGTLLRTLGATRAQVLAILTVEYATLGSVAAISASLLAGVAGWALAKWEFNARFLLPWAEMLALSAGLVALTILVGLWNSVDVLKRPPLEVLRTE